MEIIKDRKIKLFDVLIAAVFINLYMIPIYYLTDMGVRLDEYIFMIILVSFYITYLFSYKTIKIKDIFFIIFIFYIVIQHQSISETHLLSLVVIDKIIEEKDQLASKLRNTKLKYFALAFTVFYTLIYFGDNGRYIFTGIKEINQSGFLLMMLFIIIKSTNKKIGDILILIGILTFSRSYIFSVIVFYSSNLFFSNIRDNNILVKISKKFLVLGIISIIVLISLSIAFTNLYLKGELIEYQEGVSRLLSFNDYSNYFRFITNTNLLEMYSNDPRLLITGISSEKFLELNRQLAVSKGLMYRAIRPHNFFFSYLRIYGVFSVGIFLYLSTILKKVVTKKNIPVFLVVIIYASTLGMGFSNTWLFLTVFALISNDSSIE